MSHKATVRAGIALALLLSAASPLRAQTASEVFDAYAPRVFKVEILEAQSSTPEIVGTAFLVGEGGYLISNYHVINDVIYHPDRYRIRLEGVGGESEGEVRILAVEPAHDLAVLQASVPVGDAFTLVDGPPAMGTRLYSLGHPADLATAVVEGTYNGPVEHSVSPRHHFTGSVNPGMSGGPTVLADGRVVGVNVATAGNQLSFLIPAEVAAELLEEARIAPRETTEDLLEQARARADAFQDGFFGPLLDEPLPQRDLSGFDVPVGPEESFDCFTVTLDEEEEEYTGIQYRCEVADRIWLSNEQWSPFATFEHVRLASDGLNSIRFLALASQWYAATGAWDLTDDDDVTAYECRPASVKTEAGLKLRSAFCARRHESMEGLYDVLLRTAVTGISGQTVVSTFQASGISFAHARALVRRVLEGYRWNG
ncbi:MAG: serine protease [Gemmatimonadota bacterium]